MGWEDNDFDAMAPEGDTYSGGTGVEDFDSNIFNSPSTANYNFDANLTNTPDQSWFDSPNIQLSGQEQQFAGLNPSTTNFAPGAMGSVGNASQTLANIFNSKQGQAGLTGVGALLSGIQNRKKASQMQQLAQTLRQGSDPFGSQRGQYQQELSRAIQDPYSSPIVSAQVKQLQAAQAAADAKAGRRSNNATSSPALLAAQAQIAQKYIDSLMQPAGANISPNMSGFNQASMAGTQAGVDGFISPLASALGFNQRSGINEQQLAEALAKVAAMRGQ